MKPTAKTKAELFLSLNAIALTGNALLARAGGGGSGGGGHGGGGGFSGGGFSSHSSSGAAGQGVALTGIWAWIFIGGILFLFFILPILLVIKRGIQRPKGDGFFKGNFDSFRDESFDNEMDANDPLTQRVKEIFFTFEEAWGQCDLKAMRGILTENYYKRMVLELSVVQNEKRSNPMSGLQLYQARTVEPGDQTATVRIYAAAKDTLRDSETGKTLFEDNSDFVEYWHLAKEGGIWKLDFITQETEDAQSVEPEIVKFAQKNSFYYDADFGWLMMPDKGVLFSKTNFARSDINNHVIGYYRNKIVEFYTYVPYGSGPLNYLIAQAILPISYRNILVKRKKLINWGGRGLKRMYLESSDFNKKFALWADPLDQVNSLELLTTNFMERIYELPFEVNIEIVGNFLYLYTKDKEVVTYDKMLEMLSWAFDEMQM